MKFKLIIVLKFKGFRVLLMYCIDYDENRLKFLLNLMICMEVIVKLMVDKMYIYVRFIFIWLLNEKF